MWNVFALVLDKVSAPVVSVPTDPAVPFVPLGPGLIIPPAVVLLTLTVPPTMPVPPSVLPLAFTVTADELDVLPFTRSVPPVIVVAPVYVLAAVKMVVPPVPDTDAVRL